MLNGSTMIQETNKNQATLSLQKKLTILLLLSIYSLPAFAEPIGSTANKDIQAILNNYCLDCHNDRKQKADIRLDNFSELPDNLKFELLNKIEEQVYINKMPPKKSDLPTEVERNNFFAAIKRWNDLQGNKSLFRTKLDSPEYGNYLDHDKLFSGEYKNLKGFTYDRKWVISEFIFKEKMGAILRASESKKFRIDGKTGAIRGTALIGVANPFLLPTKSGVRYYANEKINSGHLMTMIGCSKNISKLMISYLSHKYHDFLPEVKAITAMKMKHDDILEKRNIYLSNQIDRLCNDIYKDKNEGLLPEYSKIKLKDTSGQQLLFTEPDPRAQKTFNGYRGSAEGIVIEMALIRYGRSSKDKEKVIRMCEKYWFHLGLERKKIELLLEKLQVNLEDFLSRSAKDAKRHSPSWKLNDLKLNDSELKVVSTTIKKLRTKGMSYKTLHKKCMDFWRTEFQKSLEESNPLKAELRKTILHQLFEKIYERLPTQNEFKEKDALLLSYSSKIGILEAITKLTQTLLLNSEFINRNEYGTGKADQFGRKMLSPRDASYAIAYALTDSSPDKQLVKAARENRLNTKADYKREVERLLKDRQHVYIIDNIIQNEGGSDNITDIPIRKLRFFREFFGYHNALKVFKDQERFGHTIQGTRERLIAEADMLVEHILKKDRNVFEELLTTDKFYVYHNGDSKNVTAISTQLKKAYDYFTKYNWRNFKNAKDLNKHRSFLISYGVPALSLNNRKGATTGIDRDIFQLFINIMSDFEKRFEKGKNQYITPYSNTRFTSFGPKRRLTGRGFNGFQFENATHFYNIDPDRWDYPPVQPAKLNNRKGILTHPAWLQAFSQNAHTDPVIRGKWIQEKLLAGKIPDVPVGVDAMIPEDHTKTLRQRLHSATSAQECWRCHKYMNPLGYAFEMYDDFGRFRTEEELEHPDNVVGEKAVKKQRIKTHPLQTVNNRGTKQGERLFYKTAPVDSTGILKGTGDNKLNGEVKNALDLLERLAKSKRVRQSIIRHAFRYFMGRNEMFTDSKTLIDAEEVYVKSGGSFDAVIISLLTSDSFIYRKEIKMNDIKFKGNNNEH